MFIKWVHNHYNHYINVQINILTFLSIIYMLIIIINKINNYFNSFLFFWIPSVIIVLGSLISNLESMKTRKSWRKNWHSCCSDMRQRQYFVTEFGALSLGENVHVVLVIVQGIVITQDRWQEVWVWDKLDMWRKSSRGERVVRHLPFSVCSTLVLCLWSQLILLLYQVMRLGAEHFPSFTLEKAQ